MFMFLSTATIRKKADPGGPDHKFEDGDTDKSKKLRDVCREGDSQESTRFYSGVGDCPWTRKARKRIMYLRRIQKKALGLLISNHKFLVACLFSFRWNESNASRPGSVSGGLGMSGSDTRGLGCDHCAFY
ncbi:hypothetical protein L1987_05923 [Smallanthus sonchifolius]|uniref:Uncharacterized protein n=1 Tax=Smallanthus sonchifolius TaxID=185202 RepID=A0ACB9JWZ0_9ASTR|nr:hypothetical protein L1987_05923 [Smallanthus sonchifolius]